MFEGISEIKMKYIMTQIYFKLKSNKIKLVTGFQTKLALHHLRRKNYLNQGFKQFSVTLRDSEYCNRGGNHNVIQYDTKIPLIQYYHDTCVMR